MNFKYHPLLKSYSFLVILFSFGIFSNCSREPRVDLIIRMENAGKTMIYLVESSNLQEQVVDSAKFDRNGKAKLSVKINVPGYYQIWFENKQSLTLLLSPDERVSITADFENIYETKKIEGSEKSIQVNIIHDSLRNTVSKLEKLKNEYSALTEAGNNQQKLESISDEYSATLKTYKKYSIGCILADLKSLVNVAVLYQEYFPGYYVFSDGKDLQFYKLVSDTLSKYYPNVKYVKYLNDNYKAMYESFQTQRILSMAKPGNNTLPDIILPDKKGTVVKLSSLQGKIVLLSFWSVKDKGCIDLNRSLMSIYKKYRNRNFEIYQVSIDHAREIWLKTIKFEEIPWISVSDTNFPNNNLQWAYNLNTVPLNYLINKDQTEIIGKNLTPSTLDEQLSKLLKK